MGKEKKTGDGFHGVKSGWLGRAATVGTLAAGTAGRLLRSKVASVGKSGEDAKDSEDAALRAAAETVRDQLGHLKGVLMKVGQMASYIDGGVPESVQEILASLQDSTPSLDEAMVRGVFAEQFGKAPEEMFADWSYLPIAAASIGQVHKARLKTGETVAVKVQYPGIKAAIASDFQNAGAVAPLLKAIFHSLDTKAVIEEIRERSLEECDYRIEAQSQIEFARIFGHASGIVIPRVYQEFSGERVLTTEFIDALRFRDFLMRSSQAERDRAAMIMHTFVCESIFVHEIFNADPHPGNYLFMADGRVCFLDYGCVKRWANGTIAKWRKMVVATIRNDFAEWRAIWGELGMVVNAKAYDYEHEFVCYRASLGPILEDREVRLSRADLKARQAVLVASKNKKHSTLPKDFVMVTRLMFGLESILAMLNAKGNFHRNIMAVMEPEARPAKSVS